MQVLFWATAVAMTIAAIAAVLVPLRLHGRAAGMPGVLIYAAIAAMAVGTYAVVGSPEAVGTVPDTPHATSGKSAYKAPGQQSKVAPSIASLVNALAERLRQEPGDAGGWLLLAQSYEHLGRRDDAIAAYNKAQTFGRNDAKLGEILNSATPEAGVTGRVAVSPDAASLLNPDDVVFVFARRGSATRMPVAAIRRRASELPFDFELTDRDAMIEGRGLSELREVSISARVSRSGKAGDNSLQLEATSEPVSTDGSGRVELTISANAPARDPANE
ncbi:MAG: hypothetical protein KJO31_00395 [Gammaproteobacteria bacterium]|nr:hypothetical protein [Gammaproteobacteria bacterium]